MTAHLTLVGRVGRRLPTCASAADLRLLQRFTACSARQHLTINCNVGPLKPSSTRNSPHSLQVHSSAATELSMSRNPGIHGDLPRVSQRILQTDKPCIVTMQQLLAGIEGLQSLAQGITYWLPPDEALAAAEQSVSTRAVSQYGPVSGDAELVDVLKDKLTRENDLTDVDVMVTAGANQAFVNLVIGLCDAGDKAILFRPYYFNHLMALQMTGVTPLYCPRRQDNFDLDLSWVRQQVHECKMVVLVNPCNPSGAVTPKQTLLELASICKQAGAWLVVDNTYEYFLFDSPASDGPPEHVCASGDNVINVFSLSKAYGMMGWRMGYIAMPRTSQELFPNIMKVQDTIPICPTRISQRVAVEALRLGKDFVVSHFDQLARNRELLLDALSPLGRDAICGPHNGAIYMLVKLPVDDDEAAMEWLAKEFKVCVIPGSSCGAPGHIRVAFANMQPEKYATACTALKRGLTAMVNNGMTV